MWRSLGVLLAPFWIRVGIRVTRKSRKHYILQLVLTTSTLFEFVAFTKTLYFTAFLTTVGLLQSSSMLFDYFLAPQIPLETLLTNPSLIKEITKTLYFYHV